DLGEAGDLEHLEDPVLGADQGQVALMATKPLETADQHPEAGRVEEVHALEVDDDLVLALADQLDQLLSESGRGVDVDLPLHRQHGERRVGVVYVETKLHRRASSWTDLLRQRYRRST